MPLHKKISTQTKAVALPKINKPKPAPAARNKPPVKAVSALKKHVATAVPAKSVVGEMIDILRLQKKRAAAKAVAAPAKKRAPQHDAAYYAAIGQRGGKSLARKRGTEFFADIARLSHPRAVYNGGRPKGSTAKKTPMDEDARMDAVIRKNVIVIKKTTKRK